MNWQQLFSPEEHKIMNAETLNFAKKSSSNKKVSLKQFRHSPLIRFNNENKENIFPHFTPNQPQNAQDSFSKLIFKQFPNDYSLQDQESNTALKDLTDKLKQLCKISKKQLLCQQNFLQKIQQSIILKKKSDSKIQRSANTIRQSKIKSTVYKASTVEQKIEVKIKHFEKLKKELKLLMSQSAKPAIKKCNKRRAISAF